MYCYLGIDKWLKFKFNFYFMKISYDSLSFCLLENHSFVMSSNETCRSYTLVWWLIYVDGAGTMTNNNSSEIRQVNTALKWMNFKTGNKIKWNMEQYGQNSIVKMKFIESNRQCSMEVFKLSHKNRYQIFRCRWWWSFVVEKKNK